MGEAKPPGVQGLARKCRNLPPNRARMGDGSSGAPAVDRLADQRMAAMG